MPRAIALVLSAVALAPPGMAAHSHKKRLEIVHPWTPATTEKTARHDTGVHEDQEPRAADKLLRAFDASVAASVAPHGVPSVPTRQPRRSPPSSSVPAGHVELVHNGLHLLLSGVKKGSTPTTPSS